MHPKEVPPLGSKTQSPSHSPSGGPSPLAGPRGPSAAHQSRAVARTFPLGVPGNPGGAHGGWGGAAQGQLLSWGSGDWQVRLEPQKPHPKYTTAPETPGGTFPYPKGSGPLLPPSRSWQQLLHPPPPRSLLGKGQCHHTPPGSWLGRGTAKSIPKQALMEGTSFLPRVPEGGRPDAAPRGGCPITVGLPWKRPSLMYLPKRVSILHWWGSQETSPSNRNSLGGGGRHRRAQKVQAMSGFQGQNQHRVLGPVADG